MKSLLFLDWDGVACPWLVKDEDEHIFEGRFRQPCDRRCLAALQWLLEQTGAEIVISSSWRQFVPAAADWEAELHRLGVTSARVVGITPRPTEETPYACRGEEIDAWLRENDPSANFIILDDNDDMEPHWGRLVQTKMHIGLTMEDARLAAYRLDPSMDRSKER